MSAGHHAVEQVVRESYGRLLAFLASRFRDVTAAEDALADSLARALELWPLNGVPSNPEAWLLTVARNRLIDAARHQSVRAMAESDMAEALRELTERTQMGELFPDERLHMLFLCTHPAIDQAARTPLMLQVVLGLDAATIAHSFLVRPSTMGQGLVRAKAKIRDARIRFDVPEAPQLNARLPFVLNAIYAAYSTAWGHLGATDLDHNELASEAIYLGQLLADFLPAEPEAHGLLALMLYCEARKTARLTPDGAYVPLKQQDRSRWSRTMIIAAERHLQSASTHRRPGRFQLEAAIQSAHIHQALTGAANGESIARLYEALVQVTPTIGVQVNYAAALAEVNGPQAALNALTRISAGSAEFYQPYWALAGHLYQCSSQQIEAVCAYERAIALSHDEPVRCYLRRRMAQSKTEENTHA